jgi:hypothetical protein
MKQCGLKSQSPYLRERIASREIHGGNVHWVIREFPRELIACRRRHQGFADTLLILVADADDFEVEARRQHLEKSLEDAQLDPMAPDDPLVLLIPRRNIETWIHSALGEGVNETDDYKRSKHARDEIRAAARVIHQWARAGAQPAKLCVQSLRDALPSWRRIG